ncbi:MAG: DUF3147 family protein [Gammaproteobacteria bacterium]|nr:DUF3147 family protein [Gammaproteobacteria bacterium]
MIPSLDFSSLKESHWSQFGARFVIGGAVTLGTGLVARHWGALVGGLFLSFPALFGATATLIERNETAKKKKAGINCRARGRKAAALDAAGAALGGWGMLCFALVAWLTLARYPTALALSLAGMLWLIVSASLWWVRRHA